MLRMSDDDSDKYSEGLGSLLRQLIDHQDFLHALGINSPKLRQLLLSLKVLESDIRLKISQRKQSVKNLAVSLFSENDITSPSGNSLHSEEWTNAQNVESEDTNRIPMYFDNEFIDPFDWERRPSARGLKAKIWGAVKKKWTVIIKFIR